MMLATIHWTIGHWGNWWVDNFYYYTSVWLASILLIYSRCGCLVTVSHKQCTNSNRKTCTDSNVGTTAKDDFWPNNLWLKPKYIIITVDNRILNFLDWILFGNFHWENVLNVHKLKNSGHFERRATTGQRNTPHHKYIAVDARKLTSSCLRT